MTNAVNKYERHFMIDSGHTDVSQQIQKRKKEIR